MNKQSSEIDESVGPDFSTDLLREAQDITLKVIEEAKEFLKPGKTEDELKAKISEIQKSLGVEQAWHKPQVRFGANTTLPFGVPGFKNKALMDNDIAFIDLGLIFKGHEGDVGRTYSIGSNELMKKCCIDVREVWQQTRDYWKKTKTSGEDLYKYAENLSSDLGWRLARKQANGHRISDFPHIVRNRKTSIDQVKSPLKENRWILEIQILENQGSFGAFFEDILN